MVENDPMTPGDGADVEQNMPPQDQAQEPMQEPMQEDVIPENQQATDQVESQLVNEGAAELGPGQEMQLEAYKDNATITVFSEKSQASILQSLQATDDPIKNVAKTTMIIHKRLESSLQQGGEKMTEITMALGAAHLVSELVVLAEAARLYQLSPDDSLQAYRTALMMYFNAGLVDKSISISEFQETIEPLMTKDQREFGLQEMNKNGLSSTKPPDDMFQGKGQQQPQGILSGR